MDIKKRKEELIEIIEDCCLEQSEEIMCYYSIKLSANDIANQEQEMIDQERKKAVKEVLDYLISHVPILENGYEEEYEYILKQYGIEL